MQMYSADIFISSTALFVAQDMAEASHMVEKATKTAITVPQDEFFTDRFFSDPFLGNLTFATTFTFWTLLKDKGMVDRGPVEAFVKGERQRHNQRSYRLLSGKAMIGATVYIKADWPSEAEATFRGLDQTPFKFGTNGNGVALLGLNELEGICFEDTFTCHILEQNKLMHRGACARYLGPEDGKHQAGARSH